MQNSARCVLPVMSVAMSWCGNGWTSDSRGYRYSERDARSGKRWPAIPPILYGLNETHPSQEKDDEQEVFYTTALTPELANGHLHNAHPVTLEGGEYVMFTYEGLGTGLQEFILTVYGTCMPMLNLTRRKGLDIERFFPEDENRNQEPPIQLRCEYLIPIRR